MKDKNIIMPNIRFNKFKDSWNTQQLLSLVQHVKSYTITREKEEFSGSTEYIHYGDIHRFKRSIITKTLTLPTIREGSYQALKNGDIVLADASEDFKEIAKPMVLFDTSGRKIVAGLHTIALRPVSINSLFLYYLLDTSKFHWFTRKTGTGLKVFGISAKNLLKFSANVPTLEEQKRISLVILKVDNLITLNENKISDIKKLKKVVLQITFNQSWRFNGFTLPWEQRKLGDISSIFDGTHQTPNYQSRGIPFLSVENISTLNTNKFISEKDFENNFKEFPQPGDILMTRIGDVGTPQLINYTGKVAYYVSLALIKPRIDSSFLKYRIESAGFQKELWKRTLHVAFPKKINKKDIGKIPVTFPKKCEQVKIGRIFMNLDNLIVANEKKLDQLKQLKKYLMQNMFV